MVKGETLSSIAGHYRVKVATLKRVNHIIDERKLRVGQKLIIPGAETDPVDLENKQAQQTPATREPAARPSPAESPSGGQGNLWDRLKNL